MPSVASSVEVGRGLSRPLLWAALASVGAHAVVLTAVPAVGTGPGAEPRPIPVEVVTLPAEPPPPPPAPAPPRRAAPRPAAAVPAPRTPVPAPAPTPPAMLDQALPAAPMPSPAVEAPSRLAPVPSRDSAPALAMPRASDASALLTTRPGAMSLLADAPASSQRERPAPDVTGGGGRSDLPGWRSVDVAGPAVSGGGPPGGLLAMPAVPGPGGGGSGGTSGPPGPAAPSSGTGGAASPAAPRAASGSGGLMAAIVGDGPGRAGGFLRPVGGYQAVPAYPEGPRRLGIEGTSHLRVEVLATGVIGQVVVDRTAGHPDLDRAAVTAVRTWRFEPARRDGEPVAVWATLDVRFELR